MSTVTELVAQQESLAVGRASFDRYWQIVHDTYWPSGAEFTTKQQPGENRALNIADPTGLVVLDRFTAMLESFLVPQHLRWHLLRASLPELNDEPGVADYFERVTDILFRYREQPSAGFYGELNPALKSLGAYGNQCLFVDPPTLSFGLSYRSVHVGQVWIELDDRGRIDTVFNRFELSAKQAKDRWGAQAPGSAIRQFERGRPYATSEYLHVVKPRPLSQYDPERLDERGKRFQSWEISLEDKAPIGVLGGVDGSVSETSGFYEMPYIYSRMTKATGERYGRGPAMMYLGANLTLQEMTRTELAQGKRSVAPPWLAASEDFLTDGEGDLDLRPDAVNYGWLDDAGRPKVAPADTGFQYTLSREFREEQKQNLNDGHLLSLWQILTETSQMTATEALIRAREKAALIGPPVGRQRTELLGPLIHRELGLLARQGLLPDPPEVLLEAEDEYEVVYDSDATQVQREAEVSRVRAWMEDIAIASELDPTARLAVKGPEVARWMAEARGVLDTLVASEDEIRAMIEQQAEAQAEEEASQLEQAGARTLRDLSSAGIEVAG